jgi:hypothetical protein
VFFYRAGVKKETVIMSSIATVSNMSIIISKKKHEAAMLVEP